MPYTYKHEIDAIVRKAGDKYEGNLIAAGVPTSTNAGYGTIENKALSYIRAGYYRDEVQDAFEYGEAQLFGVFRYAASGHYSVESIAHGQPFVDPSKASLKAWELDPKWARLY